MHGPVLPEHGEKETRYSRERRRERERERERDRRWLAFYRAAKVALSAGQWRCARARNISCLLAFNGFPFGEFIPYIPRRTRVHVCVCTYESKYGYTEMMMTMVHGKVEIRCGAEAQVEGLVFPSGTIWVYIYTSRYLLLL